MFERLRCQSPNIIFLYSYSDSSRNSHFVIIKSKEVSITNKLQTNKPIIWLLFSPDTSEKTAKATGDLVHEFDPFDVDPNDPFDVDVS